MRYLVTSSKAVALVGGLAIAVAAAGTAIAVPRAHHISGSLIKKHTIAGNRLINNTLTGTQINESRLGRVPSARSAGTAGNAQHLGGIGPSGFVRSNRFFHFSFTMKKTDANKVIGTYGPLTFTASCTTDGFNTLAAIDVTSSVAHVLVSTPTGSYYDMDTSTPAVLSDIMDSSPDDDIQHPWAFSPTGDFTLDTGNAVMILINTDVGDCAFAGHLTNVAG